MPNPAKSKKVRFEFSKIEMPEGAPEFVNLLAHAKGLPLQDRVRQKGGTPIRWEHLDQINGGMWVGDITRIKDDVVPNKASPNKAREHIDLKADEGPTEDTAFGYDPALGVMITQCSFHGLAAAQIAGYFYQLQVANGVVNAYVVMTQEGVEKLENFQYFDKLTYKVARPSKGPLAATGLDSLDSQIRAASDLGAKYCTIEFSVGRAKSKILKERATAVAARLMNLKGQKGNPVRKLNFEGMTLDGRNEPFDLLKNRLTALRDVEVSEEREMTFDSRKAALLSAYESVLQVLQAQFGVE